MNETNYARKNGLKPKCNGTKKVSNTAITYTELGALKLHKYEWIEKKKERINPYFLT